MRTRKHLSACNHHWYANKMSVVTYISKLLIGNSLLYLDSYDHVARIANILDMIVRIIQSIYSQRPFSVSGL